MDARFRMREWGVPHRVLGGMGMKFFEFDSKQTLLDIVSKHFGPLDEWPYVKPFAVLAWQYISGSRQRGVTESNWDWKHGSHWLVSLGCYDGKIYQSHQCQQHLDLGEGSQVPKRHSEVLDIVIGHSHCHLHGRNSIEGI